jgi:hypothetical protein
MHPPIQENYDLSPQIRPAAPVRHKLLKKPGKISASLPPKSQRQRSCCALTGGVFLFNKKLLPEKFTL